MSFLFSPFAFPFQTSHRLELAFGAAVVILSEQRRLAQRARMNMYTATWQLVAVAEKALVSV